MLALKLTSEDGDLNQVPSYFMSHDDDELYGAYFALKAIEDTEIDLYWIYVNGHGGFARDSEGFPLYPLANAYFHTFGARIGGELDLACGLDYNVEGAIQTGTTHSNALDLDTDGWSVEAELGLTFTRSSRFRVFARGFYASGPDDESSGYLILYPNRFSNTGFRARYGIADMIPETDVISLQAGFHFDPCRDWTFGATGLWAGVDEEFMGLDEDYGSEVDLWAEYRYGRQITLSAGLAVVFPDESGGLLLESSDDTQFVSYVQARLAF